MHRARARPLTPYSSLDALKKRENDITLQKMITLVYLVIRSMETVVKNVQNMRELSLKRANAFQVLRRLQFKSQY